MHRNDRLMIMLGILVVIIALIGAAVGGSAKIDDVVQDEIVNPLAWPVSTSPVKHISGNLNENSHETIGLEVNDTYVTKVIIELNWLDEAPATGPGRYENQPDTFNFTVVTPWDAIISSDEMPNPIGEAGQVREEIIVPEEGVKTSAALGTWDITIYCGNCGDQTPRVSILGIRDIQDTGNAWALTMVYEFHTNN